MKWVKIYRKLAIKRVLFFCNNIPSVDCTSRFSNPFQLNGISLYLMNFRLLNSTTKLLFSLFTLLLVSPTFVCIYSCIENPEINLMHSQWMNEWMNVCLFSVNNKKKTTWCFKTCSHSVFVWVIEMLAAAKKWILVEWKDGVICSEGEKNQSVIFMGIWILECIIGINYIECAMPGNGNKQKICGRQQSFWSINLP